MGSLARASVGCRTSLPLQSTTRFGARVSFHESRRQAPRTARRVSPCQRQHGIVATAGTSDLIQEVSARELEEAVQARAKPLVIDFYATWCGPCVLQAKELVKVAEQLGDGVQILKIDTDDNPDISNQLQIMGLPTVIIVPTDPSKPALRTEGLLSAEKIVGLINSSGSPATAAPSDVGATGLF